jgi:hypothetical protein
MTVRLETRHDAHHSMRLLYGARCMKIRLGVKSGLDLMKTSGVGRSPPAYRQYPTIFRRSFSRRCQKKKHTHHPIHFLQEWLQTASLVTPGRTVKTVGSYSRNENCQVQHSNLLRRNYEDSFVQWPCVKFTRYTAFLCRFSEHGSLIAKKTRIAETLTFSWKRQNRQCLIYQ